MALRILQISHRVPYPLNEGGTIGIYNYTRGYSEAGCEVTLATLSAKKHQVNEVEMRKALEPYCELHVFPIDTDVKVWPALKNIFSRRSYNVDRFFDEAFSKFLINLLENRSFDIIQVEGTFAAMYGQIALDYGNSPVVLRQHNVEYQIWERRATNEHNWLKSFYFRLLAKRLKRFESQHVNQYDAMIPVTVDDGILFEKMGCRIPIKASPAGIDMELWKPTNGVVDLASVFHLGSLEWGPNIEAVKWFLNEVWPLIYSQNPEINFYVAGKGMSDELRNTQIAGVHMLGEVSDAVQFVSDKAICVVPLLSGSGIRLKILEAMSAGKLVVSTSIGAQGIHYRDQENILIADDAQFMAETILAMVANPVKMERIASSGRELIEKEYGNQSVIKHLLDFFQVLIEKKSRKKMTHLERRKS
jgi:glycosyltransferase involved in cell wall biosynthesis